MDYEKLIKRLRKYADFGAKLVVCEDAATAIETLLAERDAAVKELHGRCSKCKHFSSGLLEFPCTDCRFERGTSDHWEWRGPQKGAGDE